MPSVIIQVESSRKGQDTVRTLTSEEIKRYNPHLNFQILIPSKISHNPNNALANNQHRARRMADHFMAGASEYQFGNGAHAARAHDDHRAAARFRHFDN